jgi:hypothetical protein
MYYVGAGLKPARLGGQVKNLTLQTGYFLMKRHASNGNTSYSKLL